jgi:hypothetical protein
LVPVAGNVVSIGRQEKKLALAEPPKRVSTIRIGAFVKHRKFPCRLRHAMAPSKQAAVTTVQKLEQNWLYRFAVAIAISLNFVF